MKDQNSADAQQLVDTYHFPKETEKAKISSKVRDSGEPFLGLHFRNFKTVIKSPPTFPRRSIYSLSHGCTHSRPHSLHSLVCDGIIVGETQRDGNLRCGGCELDDDLLGGHSGDQGVRIGHRPELQRRVCSGDVHRRGGSHLDWDAGVGRVSEGHVCSVTRSRARDVSRRHLLARRRCQIVGFSGPLSTSTATSQPTPVK